MVVLQSPFPPTKFIMLLLEHLPAQNLIKFQSSLKPITGFIHSLMKELLTEEALHEIYLKYINFVSDLAKEVASVDYILRVYLKGRDDILIVWFETKPLTGNLEKDLENEKRISEIVRFLSVKYPEVNFYHASFKESEVPAEWLKEAVVIKDSSSASTRKKPVKP